MPASSAGSGRRTITSKSSDAVKRVRALDSRSGRRKAGRFVVEGPQGLHAALDAHVPVDEVFVTEAYESEDITASAERAGARISWVSPAVMAAMAQTQSPQGLLAVCALPQPLELPDIMAGAGPVLVLDQVADPGNVGTIIRTADAAAAAGVVLTAHSADPYSGKVVRSTTGSLFHLPIHTGCTIGDAVGAAKAERRTVAVTAAAAPIDLFRAADGGQVDSRTCWIIGSEAHGASADALAIADLAVSIPMSGRAESLNAAVAAAIVLYVTRHAERAMR